MKWTKGGFCIDTDKNFLDIQVTCGFVKPSYPRSTRVLEQIRASIARSIGFGVYHKGRKVGFARLITDEVVISWLGDVFIIPDYQKQGLGKWLMECVTSHPFMKKTNAHSKEKTPTVFTSNRAGILKRSCSGL
jgi:GNAT superfamily N-acetyltransferase